MDRQSTKASLAIILTHREGLHIMLRVWKKSFLAALEETGSVKEATEACTVSKVTVYAHRRDDPTFAKEWEEALDRAADALEDEARKRAIEGTQEPVFHKGEIVGYVAKKSDVLLMFLLKGIRPQKWRESRATLPPAELNKLIEAEFERRAKEKETESQSSIM